MPKFIFFHAKYKAVTAVIFVSVILSIASTGFGAEIDKTKYITFDEIKPGMDAYCLTVIKGTKIEKFPLKVLSLIEHFRPGRNAILVTGVDETFQKIGAVRGCSGSPVYIDGRMAGALAAGYAYAKDPIYLVTPIEDMLSIGTAPGSLEQTRQTNMQTLNIDFSAPVDLAKIYEQVMGDLQNIKNTSGQTRPMALVTSLPENVCNDLTGLFSPYGLLPVSGGAITSSDADTDTTGKPYQPGGVISVPLLSGDLSMSAMGTVTEVVGDTVYGFGHNFLGYGKVNFPMAAGKIHTVVASRQMSFKLGQSGPVNGTLVFDQATGILGKIGQMPHLIDLRITVDRFNDTQKRVYDCKMAYNRLYTPALIQAAIAGAGSLTGTLPSDHTVSYRIKVRVDGVEPIVFNNISSGTDYSEVISQTVGTVSLFMNNPYKLVDIKSVEVEMDITAVNNRAIISSIEVSDTKLKAGQSVDINAILQSNRAPKKLYTSTIKLPDDLKPGKYSIFVTGGYNYEGLLRKLALYRFTARSLPTLVDAINTIAGIRQDKLYFILQLPSGGVTVQQERLPYLPGTKTMLLSNKKRTADIRPLNHWIENSITVGKAVLGSREIKITVEK
jgi:hypothetical protein